MVIVLVLLVGVPLRLLQFEVVVLLALVLSSGWWLGCEATSVVMLLRLEGMDKIARWMKCESDLD